MTALKYTAQPDSLGWGVFEPVTGHRVALYSFVMDGELAETLARSTAGEKNAELELMARFLHVTPRAFIDALAETRGQIDNLVHGGVL